jgi:hypothetical protein
VAGDHGKWEFFYFRQDTSFTESFSIALQKDEHGVVKAVLQVRCGSVR